MKNEVLDIIISLVAGCKSQEKSVCSYIDGKQYKLYAAVYLLGQVLRQYAIDNDHIFVSKKAKEVWSRLTNDEIKKTTYRNKVICKDGVDEELKTYKGASKVGVMTRINNYFIYNDIFHDDHIIPINVIIDELCQLNTLDYNSVEKVLDKIYICKMLKEEDRDIINKYRRSSDVKDVIEKDYKNTHSGRPVEIDG